MQHKSDWALVLANLVALLKPGGAIQWCENDTSRASRYALRGGPPSASQGGDPTLTTPTPTPSCPTINDPPSANAFTRSYNTLLGDLPARVEALVYGIENLEALFADPQIGNLAGVFHDAYSTDAVPELRAEYTLMGVEAIITLMEGAFGSHVAGQDLEGWRRELVEEVGRGVYVRMTCCNFVGWKKG